MILEIITSELDFYVIERVRELRIKFNPRMDQVELAQRLGVSEGYIGSIENPKIKAKYNIRMLGRIAKALGLQSYKELFPETILSNDIVRIRLELLQTAPRKQDVDENGQIAKRFNIIAVKPLADADLELWRQNKLEYLKIIKK